MMNTLVSPDTEKEAQSAPPPIVIEASVCEAANFAMQHNGMALIQSVQIRNAGATQLSDLVLRATFAPAFAADLEAAIPFIAAGTTVRLDEFAPALDAEYLAGLGEQEAGLVRIECMAGETCVGRFERQIRVLAFDEYPGHHFMPALLAAFVTPDHPDVVRLLASAASLLERLTGNPLLDGYQSDDIDRVRAQIAAIYGAIQRENIACRAQPDELEAHGRRVRTADTIARDRLGACLDFACLYASCLEAAGLHPLLVVLEGHSLVGVWLESACFSETVQDDVSVLSKRAADGVNAICLVEPTCMAAGQDADFEAAQDAAQAALNGSRPFLYAVDIRCARGAGIRPLPPRVWAEDGWRIERELRAQNDLTRMPARAQSAYAVPDARPPSARISSRIDLWQRKLLDLSLRNSLLNLRFTQNMLPLLCHKLNRLKDALSEGEEFQVMGRAADMFARPDDGTLYDMSVKGTQLHAELKLDFENHLLRIPYAQAEVERSIVHLYRSARTSMEENGANTLYLALGSLKWFETDLSQKPRYAPIVLMPVELVRRSVKAGYILRLRDEEPQMNITLLELLRQDFGIAVTGLDPLPRDEQGIDLRAVLSVMRDAVAEKPRWDVIEGAFLGIFSFAQFVMWNDIRNRMEDLSQSPIVRSLCEGRLMWARGPMEDGPDAQASDEILLPIPADASQLQAIRAAMSGESFVLHGPPGTGKSQTITNMIANALARGKRVLFVAEKMAALSVVEKRLESIGLKPFCLELHSNKSKKRDVLEQLAGAVEAVRLMQDAGYEKTREQLEAMRREIDAHARVLHAPRACGLSLYQLIARYEGAKDAPEAIRFERAYLASLSPDQLEEHEHLLAQLALAARLIGHPHGHPLAALRIDRYGQQLRSSAQALLNEYEQALARAIEESRTLSQWVHVEDDLSWDGVERLKQLASACVRTGNTPAVYLGQRPLPERMREVLAACGQMRAAQEIRATILRCAHTTIFALDAEALIAQWRAADQKWLLARAAGHGRVRKQLAPHLSARRLSDEQVGGLLAALIDHKAESAQAERARRALEHGLQVRGDSLADQERWASETLRAHAEIAALYGEDCAAHTVASLASGRGSPFGRCETLLDACARLEEIARRVRALLDPSEGAWSEGQALDRCRALCAAWRAHIGEIRPYVAWRNACTAAEQAGLAPVVRAYCEGLAHDALPGAYRRALYYGLTACAFAQDEAADGFTGELFEETLRRYKALDARFIEMTKRRIYAQLAARMPNPNTAASQNSELGILQRAIRGGGRGVSIRRLMESMPTLIEKLCPCMLMSPISTAQYLDPKCAPFDLVIFDEASQLPTCKAVGVLARAKSAVIVGDPNQLPPTSFFTVNSTDEDNLETEDLESILDDCLALTMRDTHLKWHYRSRHESLIAFSNEQYYGGKLLTFPSPNELSSKVRFVPIEGFYDRGRSKRNVAEARAIVDEIAHRLRARPGQSLGVVTFNAAQQDLIDDMLTDELRLNPELEEAAFNAPEPLFIKNLENVQGDERDVILFSVGYGPDQLGKVSLNFGPLNRDGGWRRLNVAVSRARDEMMVFSTLDPADLDASRTAARGVAGLKQFLEYAKSGQSAARAPGGDEIDELARDIAQALNARGHDTRLMVGRSGYRVDVGVLDPRDPESYILGILLDGANYMSAETVRDRTISHESILKRLGWNVVRVWAIDWWDDAPRQLDRLLAHLEELVQGRAQPPESPGQAGEIGPSSAPQARNEAPRALPDAPETPPEAMQAPPEIAPPPEIPLIPYRAHVLEVTPVSTDSFVLPGHKRRLSARIRQVIDAEGPISESLLIRRVLQSYGIARASSRVLRYLQPILKGLRCDRYAQDGETIFFSRERGGIAGYREFRVADGEETRREARDLPWHELANAAEAVLKAQFGLPIGDLARETARLMGYARVGQALEYALRRGIELLIEQKRARVDGEMVSGTD